MAFQKFLHDKRRVGAFGQCVTKGFEKSRNYFNNSKGTLATTFCITKTIHLKLNNITTMPVERHKSDVSAFRLHKIFFARF